MIAEGFALTAAKSTRCVTRESTLRGKRGARYVQKYGLLLPLVLSLGGIRFVR